MFGVTPVTNLAQAKNIIKKSIICALESYIHNDLSLKTFSFNRVANDITSFVNQHYDFSKCKYLSRRSNFFGHHLFCSLNIRNAFPFHIDTMELIHILEDSPEFEEYSNLPNEYLKVINEKPDPVPVHTLAQARDIMKKTIIDVLEFYLKLDPSGKTVSFDGVVNCITDVLEEEYDFSRCKELNSSTEIFGITYPFIISGVDLVSIIVNNPEFNKYKFMIH